MLETNFMCFTTFHFIFHFIKIFYNFLRIRKRVAKKCEKSSLIRVFFVFVYRCVQ